MNTQDNRNSWWKMSQVDFVSKKYAHLQRNPDLSRQDTKSLKKP